MTSTSATTTFEVYQRLDGRFAWRLLNGEGTVFATDGSQGYDDAVSAEAMGRLVLSGYFGVADRHEPARP